MSFEETVRAKHAIRDRVKKLLSYASGLTDDELEIALARIADTLLSTSDELQRSDLQLKVVVLNRYLELRQANQVQFSEMMRKKIQSDAEKEWVAAIPSFWKQLFGDPSTDTGPIKPTWPECFIDGLCNLELLGSDWAGATVPDDISADEVKRLL